MEVFLPYLSTNNNEFWEKFLPLALKIFIAAVLVIFFLQFWVVNRLTTMGGKIAEIKASKLKLQVENKVLENAIASKSALLELSEKAKGFGFEKINTPEYIK
ncbi:hypothetical protein A2617_04165 [Candidatus Daviesbacteria bacterium RIFOXYD1_FULL_41_10]|uniref:Uncharacterized protein n=1 Tax=Candidatus Daviesbacteria bacterium RIFOXYD1_FULL_41_10 TaxID=1797801 RepID=A0A1F5N0T6_9BACT|nr:MAG: hypothetical protein A2617_04165 [Candidatus Daviesbacteria bacterium RIFOXYD1_FULL_41_10]